MKLTTKFKKGDKYIIARCPELGVTTQGKNLKEAKKNLRDAVELHIDTMIDYIKIIILPRN